MAAWLTDECHLLGLALQNWMWALAAGFCVYLLVLALSHMRHPHSD